MSFMLKYTFYIVFLFLSFNSYALECPHDHEIASQDTQEFIVNTRDKLNIISQLLERESFEEQKQQLSEGIQFALDCKRNADALIQENITCETCTDLIRRLEETKQECENVLSFKKTALKKLLINNDISTYITKNSLPQDPKKSANNKASDLNTFLRETLFTPESTIQQFQIPSALPSSEDEPIGFYQDSKITISVKNFRKNLENLNSPTEYKDGWVADNNKLTWFGTETREFHPGKKIENWKNYVTNTNGKNLSAHTRDKMSEFQLTSTEVADKFHVDPNTGTEFRTFDVENTIDLTPVAGGLIDPERMNWISERREISLPQDKTLITRTYYKKKGDRDRAPTNDDESVTIVQESDEGLHIITRSYHRGQRYTNAADIANIGPNMVWDPETTLEQYKEWKIGLFEHFSKNP